MDKTTLGDRMKSYEKACDPVIDQSQPIVLRLDGNSFSKFTKKHKFEKPFDERMTKAMKASTLATLEYCSHFVLGYTQSDEITVIINPESIEGDLFLGGRMTKICSLLASHCAGAFNDSLHEQGLHVFADFDCRIFNVPKEDVINALIWRQQDCWKNYIGVLAHYLIEGSMHKVSTKEKVELLKKNNIDPLKDFATSYHYGSTFYRKKEFYGNPQKKVL